MAADQLISGGRVLTPSGLQHRSIHVSDGRIKALLPPDEHPNVGKVHHADGLVILPGLVDTHVHINEPGRTEWEGFATATAAAAAGGITTLVDMPLNSTPVTTTAAAFHQKLEAACGHIRVDCGFWGGVVPGNAGDIQPLIDAGVLGFKCFLTHSGIDDFPNATEADLRAAMPLLAKAGLPLLAHAEIDVPAPPPGADRRSHLAWMASRPASTEVVAVELLLRLCRETSCPTHIVHVAAADVLGPLAAARRAGLPVTAETCPHYLYFVAEDVPDGATEFKCAPPIRGADNREGLWAALADGTLDLIASDHSPCPPAMKCRDTGDFFRAWGGIASLQFGLSIIWTEALQRGFGLVDVVRWMATEPARLAGLGHCKGRIAPGYDADLVFFDPHGKTRIAESRVLHRHKLTPYQGQELVGAVHATMLRGETVYARGYPLSGNPGRVILSPRTRTNTP